MESWLQEKEGMPDTVHNNRHSNTTSSDKIARLPIGPVCRSTIRSYHRVSFFHSTGLSMKGDKKRQLETSRESDHNIEDEGVINDEPNGAMSSLPAGLPEDDNYESGDETEEDECAAVMQNLFMNNATVEVQNVLMNNASIKMQNAPMNDAVREDFTKLKPPPKKVTRIVTECCGKELNSKSLPSHQKTCKIFNKVNTK